MIQKVTANVYAETGVRGCNHTFVITKEGIVLIDTPQMPADAQRQYVAESAADTARVEAQAIDKVSRCMSTMKPFPREQRKAMRLRQTIDETLDAWEQYCDANAENARAVEQASARAVPPPKS